MGTEVQIREATHGDLDRVVELYDAICDYLDATFNYPGWTRGEYPARWTAEQALANGELYVCADGEALLGTCILNGVQPEGYRDIPWQEGISPAGICCGSPNNMPKDMESAASAWTSMNGMSLVYASMNGMATMLREKPICIWVTTAHKFPVVTKRSSIKEKDYADQ